VVADPPLDREALLVQRTRPVEIARDSMKHAVETRGEALAPGETGSSAALDALAGQLEPALVVEAEESEAVAPCGDTGFTLRSELRTRRTSSSTAKAFRARARAPMMRAAVRGSPRALENAWTKSERGLPRGILIPVPLACRTYMKVRLHTCAIWITV